MSRIALLFAAVTAAFLLAGCGEANQDFIKDAVEGNLAEIQLGRLALEKAQAPAVRAFGQELVTDHSAANQKAMALATSMGVTPPTGPNNKQKATYDRLSKLSGQDFDREFIKEMVDDHKKDVQAFEKQAKVNNAVGKFAQDTLPVLQKHLQHVQALENQPRAAAEGQH